MYRLTTPAVAALLTLGLVAQASAGHCSRRPPIYIQPAPVPTIAYRPISFPQPIPQPIVARPYYFGMSLQLIQTQYGIGLQVANVTPGGPAARAGLELGDILLASGRSTFNSATSNQHGVAMLQRSVRSYGGGIGGGGGGPVPTATTLVSAHVVPPLAYADLQVLDVRTGLVTSLRVTPERIGGIVGPPVPTATATAPSPAPTLSPPVISPNPQPTATATR